MRSTTFSESLSVRKWDDGDHPKHDPGHTGRGSHFYMSRFASLALLWMNDFRDETSSPIRMSKILSASCASSMLTSLSTRFWGFIVVSHSSSGFISPKPL